MVMVVIGELFKICTKANGLGSLSQGIINQYITYVSDKIDIGSMAWVYEPSELASVLATIRQTLPVLTDRAGHPPFSPSLGLPLPCCVESIYPSCSWAGQEARKK